MASFGRVGQMHSAGDRFNPWWETIPPRALHG